MSCMPCLHLPFTTDHNWLTSFFLYLVTGKELQINMSSVMTLTFNAVELCIVTINEKPWKHAREMCRALKYNKKTANIVKNHCSKKTMPRSIK